MKYSLSETARGFTLIELLLAITVLGVLLGIAVPSFVDTIRNNRLATASNELVSALALARNEAITRRLQISVCTRDGDACATGSGSTDWNRGWLVFTDDLAPSGALDAPTDVLLRATDAVEGVSMTSTVSSFTFSPTGALASATVTITKDGCTGMNTRQLTVELTGRVRLRKEAC